MDILRLIVDEIESTKGKDIKIYDFDKINPFYRYMVNCTVTSDRQLNAIAANIKNELATKGIDVRIEGKNGASWVLVDAKEYIVNIFIEEERENFQLDKLFMAVPQVELSE